MKLLRSALGLAQKALVFYFTRVYEAVKYVVSIFGASAITAALMIPLGILTSLLMQHLGFDMSLPADPTDLGGFNWKEAAGLFLVVGVMEEVWCRYLIMECLMEKWLKFPPWLSLWASSIMFGLAHFSNPGPWYARLPQVIGATGAGFWFAYLYRKRGLHFAIFTHALYDFEVTLLSRFF